MIEMKEREINENRVVSIVILVLSRNKFFYQLLLWM